MLYRAIPSPRRLTPPHASTTSSMPLRPISRIELTMSLLAIAIFPSSYTYASPMTRFASHTFIVSGYRQYISKPQLYYEMPATNYHYERIFIGDIWRGNTLRMQSALQIEIWFYISHMSNYTMHIWYMMKILYMVAYVRYQIRLRYDGYCIPPLGPLYSATYFSAAIIACLLPYKYLLLRSASRVSHSLCLLLLCYR